MTVVIRVLKRYYFILRNVTATATLDHDHELNIYGTSARKRNFFVYDRSWLKHFFFFYYCRSCNFRSLDIVCIHTRTYVCTRRWIIQHKSNKKMLLSVCVKMIGSRQRKWKCLPQVKCDKLMGSLLFKIIYEREREKKNSEKWSNCC